MTPTGPPVVTPSPGGLLPLEVYVVAGDGVWHYRPDGHRVGQVRPSDLRGHLAELDAAWSRSGPPRRSAGSTGRPPVADGHVAVDQPRGTVMVPAGGGFDPGGIGKGPAADLVCGELLATGATGACVNVGGDRRVGGRPPGRQGWRVGLGRHATVVSTWRGGSV